MRDAALAGDERFEADDGAYRVRSAEFEATVRPGDDRWTVVVELPTIDAAVAGEDVADVVVEGWHDTLRRRLADASGVARADVAPPDVERRGDVVVVELSFHAGASPADAAVALVNFVEGTWFQGLIPGYEYVESVQAMRDRARQRGESG